MIESVIKMKANEMENGMKGIVKKIELNEKDTKRLFYLGLSIDCELEFIQKAPCKDPILFFVRGNQIILRASDAKNIEVEILI